MELIENNFYWSHDGRLAFSGNRCELPDSVDQHSEFTGWIYDAEDEQWCAESWAKNGDWLEWQAGQWDNSLVEHIGPDHPGFTHRDQRPKTRKLVPWKLGPEHFGKTVVHQEATVSGQITGHDADYFHVGASYVRPGMLLNHWKQLDGSPCGDWVEE